MDCVDSKVFCRYRWLVILVSMVCLQAQAAPLFEDASVLDVQLSGPVSSLIKNKAFGLKFFVRMLRV